MRGANKVRKQFEKEAYVLRVRERGANLTSNLPAGQNKESALREVKHGHRQKAQFQQIKDNTGSQESSGIFHTRPL